MREFTFLMWSLAVNQIYIENVKQIITQCGKSHAAILFGREVRKR